MRKAPNYQDRRQTIKDCCTPITSLARRAFGLIMLIPLTCQAQVERPSSEVSSPNGIVGKRQIAPEFNGGTKPNERIVSRIENRVQSRLYNRIYQNYNSGGGGSDSVVAATTRAQTTTRPMRR